MELIRCNTNMSFSSHLSEDLDTHQTFAGTSAEP